MAHNKIDSIHDYRKLCSLGRHNRLAASER